MNSARPKKPRHARAIRLNVCLSPALFQAAAKVFAEGGYSGYSDYLASKLRRDARLDAEDRQALTA